MFRVAAFVAYCTYAGRWSSVNDQAPSSSTPTMDETPGSSIVTP